MKFTYLKICAQIIIIGISLVFTLSSYAVTPAEQTFFIGSPYWFGQFDAAGFADWLRWGSPSNPHHTTPTGFYEAYHEVLSGEWGAAIYYDGIATEPNSMWLTNRFLFPYWNTNCNFNTVSANSWDDVNNPISPSYAFYPEAYDYEVTTAYDTGQSVIENGQVRITVDYEVVDLDANYSPMTITDANGRIGYVKSDRYLFLQTYTIKNIKESGNITGLEFYQLLHSHGANDYDAAVNASYTSTAYNDPLTGYVPYNPVHKAGNFRYDFTQWNNLDDPNRSSWVTHTDWIGFSSTVEPDVYECNVYEGGHDPLFDYKPPRGTHINIENRNLNNKNYYYGETAGALGWYLPELEPNESNSITVAFMFGYGPINYSPPEYCTELSVTDDAILGCAFPDENGDSYITYTINHTASCDINDVNIVAELPLEAEYLYSVPEMWVYYDANTHSVICHRGDIDVNEAAHEYVGATHSITVRVSNAQGLTLTNTVKMYTGSSLVRTAIEDTNICCWNPVIYVDEDATGANNGSDWANAYTELRDALADVNAGMHGCANQIWAAAGTYTPTNDANLYTKTFTMIDGIDVYGHFAGWEGGIDERNLADTNNTTILSGDVDGNNTGDIDAVVTAANSRLDGWTIRKCRTNGSSGIYVSDCEPNISNCVVRDNATGIYINNGAEVRITNTFLYNNLSSGIWGVGSAGNLVTINIDRCTSGPNNAQYGLYALYSTVNAIDSNFSGNKQYGIYGNSSNLNIQKCSICSNAQRGLQCSYCTSVDIEECLIQHNAQYGIYVSGSTSFNAMRNIISNNGSSGISMSSSSNCSIIDNLIYRNGYYGISVSSFAEIRNNTIVYNGQYGIYGSGNPAVNNNIIWGNSSGGTGGGTFSYVNYNCIPSGYTGTNINLNPLFRNADANDFHLLSTSPCIDRGNPDFSSSTEKDIDNENRVVDGNDDGVHRVDIGTDEFCKSSADLNNSGTVDFTDLRIFCEDWLCDVEGLPDFVDDDFIDFADFGVFANGWRWKAGWLLDNFERGIGGEGAYFEETILEGGEMMMAISPDLTLTEVAIDEVVEPVVDANELVDWLDEIWLSGDLDDMNQLEYEEFRESVEESQN